MKKYLSIFSLLLILTACAPVELPEVSVSYAPFDERPEGYSLEDAKRDDCVVFENDNITSGQEIWDDFVTLTQARHPAFVRLAFYYTLSSPDLYDPELYSMIKNSYPSLHIQDLEYDGEKYTITLIEDGQTLSFNYKFMKLFTGDLPSPDPEYSKYTRWVLVNEETMTWARIERSLLTVQAFPINFRQVYADLS